MPDIIQPFVVVSGLAVGVTATTVITDSATLPIAVSSFNGLTGDVIGVSSVKGMTGTVILPGLNLYLYSIGII
jgi:hypothetical protein